jgi:hypothetical protein
MLRSLAALAAAGALVACAAAPVAFFRGSIEEPTFQWLFALASVAWFASATTYVSLKKG